VNWAGRYFHTVRHLKPIQIWGRIARRLRPPKAVLGVVPPSRESSGPWELPAQRSPSMLGPDRFRFLNEEGALTWGGWDVRGRSRLWLYNLHYFDDLNAEVASMRVEWHRDLLARWVADNPPGGGVGWEPYPTSVRIVNWVKWARSGNTFTDAVRESLAVQARWLAGCLETHLLGNHLFANAKALLFAGCYFEGDEAQGWIELGIDILLRELPEQILADGGHFERSPMYHALALEDMLDLINLARSFPEPLAPWTAEVSSWPGVAALMGRWLSAMCHPDGEIAFFNDAATGVAPTPDALRRYAARLGVIWEQSRGDGLVWLEQSGYVRAQRGGAVLFVDVAPVGPDYLPGHAHADTLSFELSLRGQRVVVNSGTSCYEGGERRTRERGTAAHNTVEVDGQDSSEVWAAFRVARRAQPFDVEVLLGDDAFQIEGAHDGYQRLPGKVSHRRSLTLHDGYLQVVDRLEGRFSHAVANFHFHPSSKLNSNGSEGAVRWDGGSARWQVSGCEVVIVPSAWHPEFGMSLPSSALACRLSGGGHGESCRFVLAWDSDD
jgi:uncharacterized heparinase superfamily protein